MKILMRLTKQKRSAKSELKNLEPSGDFSWRQAQIQTVQAVTTDWIIEMNKNMEKFRWQRD